MNDVQNPNSDVALVQQWLGLQHRQIEQQQNETERLRESDRNQFDYAKAALKAQERDLERGRVHERKQFRASKIFVGAVVTVSLVSLLTLVMSGHTAFAEKILDVLVPLAGGGFGGYAIGYRHAQKQFRQGSA